MKCENALIALGSNLPGEAGNSLNVCITTIDACESHAVRVVARSRWRRSPAFPAGSGPDFVNGAFMVETTLSARALLSHLHEVEARMGRVRKVRWGPRVCDLDLIAYGNSIAPDRATVSALMGEGATTAAAPDHMVLPHPRMHERAFVLAPLADIAPEWCHPVTGLSVSEMLAALPAATRAEVEVIAEDK
ncbi:MAG: 2-amino-4-hydroxy-6-hydroxymethyldihydropteridine diphosphokinase [Pikeienuella sp.]